MASSPPASPSPSVFSIRIVSLDYYMAPPVPDLDFSYSDFQGREVEEVPVIRIYGSTPAGQKTCMHVHGALPYLYIPCPEILHHNPEEGHPYVHALSHAIEKALSVKKNLPSKRQHLHGCSIVRSKKFYGYHSSEELFVRIYLYYPYEVTRLASLLLGGAILNKPFQPYESHIPYLLQFLVDYNLYGMSHIHSSKVKFRPPLPDNFLSKPTCRMRHETNEYSSSDAVGNSTIWLSATVPRFLIWPVLPAGHSQLEDKIISIVRRQSVCGLEVDTCVEDILNQKYKMYTSLSQTQSDVNMVQSLVQIWEEYERSGVQEETKSPNSCRPLPEDVLKRFVHGLEYDKALSRISAETRNYSPSEGAAVEVEVQFDKFIKSFPDIGESIKFMVSHRPRSPGKLLKHPGGENLNSLILSRSCWEDFETTTARCTMSKIQGSETISNKDSPSEIGIEDSQCKDNEALGLLSWFASSQAVEDLNTDDELVHEAILSPILSTKSYKKALEMAHLDYESASQQECQDILDSVYSIQKTKELEQKPSCPTWHEDRVSVSSGNVIPQVDGSSDDPLTSCKAEISDINLRTDRDKHSHHHEGKHSSTRLGRKNKRHKLLWGTLSLSVKPKDCEDSQIVSYDSSVDDEKKNDCESGSSLESKDACSYMAVEVATEISDAKGGKLMGEFSVRDLMRRKRFFRCEHSEPKRHLGLTEAQKDEQMPTCSEMSQFPSTEGYHNITPGETGLGEGAHFSEKQSVCEGLQEKSRYALSYLGTHQSEHDPLHGTCQSEHEPFHGEENYSNSHVGDVSPEGLRECHFCSHTESISAVNMNILQTENKQYTGYGHNSFRNVQTEESSEASTWMTFKRKPPSGSQLEMFLDNFPGSTIGAGRAISSNNLSCPQYDEKQVVDDLLPFFVSNISNRSQDPSDQDFVLGVPVHFQNDGTVLYLLTHASSPPTSDNVQRWLSKVDRSEGLSGAMENGKLEVLEDSSHKNIVPSEPQILSTHTEEKAPASHEISQISGPHEKSNLTPLSQIGFRDPASVGGGQQLTIISIEVHTESREALQPDPIFDAINVVALAIQEDTTNVLDVCVLIRGNNMEPHGRDLDGVPNYRLEKFSTEEHLLDNLSKIISSYDPDILMGWEIQRSSLGYLAERAAHLGINLLKNMSRTPSHESDLLSKHSRKAEEGSSDVVLPEASVVDAVHQDAISNDEWDWTHASGIHVGGRIVLNVWRLMRSEVKLNMYTVESVAEEVLRQKFPAIPCRVLNNWFLSGPGQARYRCLEYVVKRAKLNIQIMNQLDMINRTSELARVFGIDFYSVLSRGSQFRVESMLLRLAHTQNYVAISPGNQQVALQPAMECLPLVMEPKSGFYADPVVVLDFQSLYPSMIIAYNLCFCTCLGKVVPSRANVLGVSSYSPDPKFLAHMMQQILLTPNGVMHVSSKIRKGVLPRLLQEILSTRIMIKKVMKKLLPSEKVLQRILDARQLALKLIANVTYGYTAAGFSGRMPCAEIADSIVQCGRNTLESAIAFVNNHDKWKARVVYGDTDSMFVLLEGRSVEEAFRIGNEIASAITAMNPDPITLKMEKVYHPCFLVTKKRYVGYSYESPNQDKPKFDAKGIETVRRDTCPAVAKTLEKSLRLFFEHKNISMVKSYLERQWTRILSGKVSLQDFVFAKEVRLGTYSARASSLPPAAIVATKAMKVDPRTRPNFGERIPYVVVHREPGARLMDMVVDPSELLDINSPHRLNDLYYIHKQIIPALQRLFGLIGADLNQWFSVMPRPIRPALSKSHSFVSHCGSLTGFDDHEVEYSKKSLAKRTRIDTYYMSKHCMLCGGLFPGTAFLCAECSMNRSLVAATVVGRTSKLEREIQHLVAICNHCGGGDWILESGVKCTSLACAVFYERRKVQKELQALSSLATAAGFHPGCAADMF